MLISISRLSAGEVVAPTNAGPVRIGVYDSRAIAYAWFWSKEHQADLNRQRQAIEAARTVKDTNLVARLNQAFSEQQKGIHRQVFSGEPPTEALAAIQKRLPDLQRQAGVAAVVSRWDVATLKAYKSAEQVDVTETLVREFNPDAKQLEVIRQIQTKPLVGVDQVEAM
jgi:hypothetical protein